MADRTVTVRLQAEISRFKSAMAEAGASARQAAGEASKNWSETARSQTGAWRDMASAATASGAIITAGVGSVVKAASTWESAWTGVKKTVDGTPEQLGKLEGELRNLARTLPASHTEIAGVAAAAGQLGIKRKDIAAFTKVMIDMGESTNLSAEEAATSIARFTNIMGSVEKHGVSAYSRIGSAMVDLGNHFATTESEINSMALRLAGTGRQMNMTEGDVLGLAAAMSSVGIEAEAGGTAMSTVMKKIDSSVRDGGEGLQNFARVSGMSAEQFARAWKENPGQALTAFTAGLEKVKNSGGSVSETLTELGIKGIREQDTMLRLAGASDLLADALETGNRAFQENTALAAEASQRYETAESRIRIAWNNIKDAAITAGAAILPVFAKLADGVAATAGFFAELPAPITGTATAIAGIAGAGLLAVGGLMKLTTMVVETKAALVALGAINAGTTFSGLAGAVGKATGALGGFLGPLSMMTAGLAVGLTTISVLGKQSEKAAIGLDAMARAVDDAGASIERVNSEFANADWVSDGGFWSGGVEGINGVGDAIAKLADPGKWETLNAGTARFLGYETSFGQMENDVSNLDKSLASMVSSGNLEGAGKNFAKLAEEAKNSGASMDQIKGVFPELENAVLNYADSLGVTLTEQETLDAMMGNMPPKLAEAAAAQGTAAEAMADLGDAAGTTSASLEDVMDALTMLGMATLDETSAMGAYNEALEKLNAGLAATGAQLDESGVRFQTNTAAGREANAMIKELVTSSNDMVEAMANNGASQAELQAALQGTYDSLMVALEGMGLTTEQADILARQVLSIPADVDIESYMSDSAKIMAEATDKAVQAVPDKKNTDLTASPDSKNMANETTTAIGNIQNSKFTLLTASQGSRDMANSTSSAVNGIPGSKHSTLTASSDARDMANQTATAINSIPYRKDVTITVNKVHKESSLGKAAGLATGGMPADISTVRGFARGGGLIPGVPPVNPLEDNKAAIIQDAGEPIMVRSREFIVNEQATRDNLALLRYINAGGKITGFANGGSPAYQLQRGFYTETPINYSVTRVQDKRSTTESTGPSLQPVLSELASTIGRIKEIDDRTLFTMVKSAEKQSMRR